jgi:hypothetical protein
VPAAIAFWNFATDVRDLFQRFLDPVDVSILIRTLIEAVIFTGVLLTTIRIVRAEIDTSVLLNGWYLSARDVWMEDWDETTDEPASPVKIDVQGQRAERTIGLPSISFKSAP